MSESSASRSNKNSSDGRRRQQKDDSNNNNDFLSNLRASMNEQQQQVVDSNEETVNAGNTGKLKQYGSLEGLFDPPSRDASGASNPTSSPVAEEKKNTPEIIRATRRGSALNVPSLPPLAPNSNAYPAHRKLPPTSSMVTTAAGNAADSAAHQPVSSLLSAKIFPVKHRHQRQVSWGVVDAPSPPQHSLSDDDAQGSLEQTSGSLLEQPSLEDTITSVSIGAGSRHHYRTQSRARILSLDDVLRASPMEQEAETFILKALDDLHPSPHQQRQRSDTATSTIFTQQPGSIPDDFSLEDDEEPLAENTIIDNTDEMDLSSSSSQDDDDDDNDDEEDINNNSNSSSNRILGPPQHRRAVSVEQRLLGLTSAMALQDVRYEHDEQDDAGRRKNKKKNKSNCRMVPKTIGVRRQSYEPVNAEDVLAQNHTVLLSPSELEGWMQGDSSIPTIPKIGGKQQSIHNLATVEEADESAERQDTGDIEAQSSDGVSRRSEHQKLYYRRLFGGRSSNMHRSKSFAVAKLKSDLEVWRAFLHARKGSLYQYLKTVFFYLILPSTAIAAILFHFVENPTTGRNSDGGSASISWWILFFGVRQVMTFSSALFIQSIVIDFLSLSSKLILKLCGPLITLFLVQSKGWPFIICVWSILNFCLLYGDGSFAAHWAYWQKLIDLFNDTNPSGNVVNSDWNKTVLLIGVSVSGMVAFKRFIVGILLGRQTFDNYGSPLAKLMQKMLLLREIAKFAKEIERSAIKAEQSRPVQSTDINHETSHLAPTANPPVPTRTFEYSSGGLHGLAFAATYEDASSRRSLDTATIKTVIDTDSRDPLTGSLRESERIKIMQLLDQWEEPERQNCRGINERSSISAVLRFRKALAFIQTEYPFSFAFGSADTREHCIESAQNVFNRLLLRSPGEEVVPFETIALLTENEGGVVDQHKARDLVKLFRPDRQGNLTCLDFLKSVDAVYKRFRLLLASIENSSKIDRAFEKIINVVFYIIVVTIILSQLGFDPLALFLSLSSVILAFAFMIGSASAKYFEGLLFIIVRRPYNVGDRIHISNVQEDTPIEGARGWVVETITLFETTAIWGPTNERCSLSNASLAYSRIINGARSPQAQIWIYLKFPIDTPYDKILIFKSAAEEYLKARPREWLSLNRFLAQDVVSDQGYVKYALVVQHRSSWQDIGQLLDSKANLSSYCQEVQRQLGMNYHAPPVPVDLKYVGESVAGGGGGMDSTDDLDSVARREEFRSMALSRHNINLLDR